MENTQDNILKISTKKTYKQYKDKFIEKLGGMDAFIKYNREHALKGYHKHKLAHINDPKPEPKKRGRPKTKPDIIRGKRGRPAKSPSGSETSNKIIKPREIKISIETLEDIKQKIKDNEIKQALSILLKYI